MKFLILASVVLAVAVAYPFNSWNGANDFLGLQATSTFSGEPSDPEEEACMNRTVAVCGNACRPEKENEIHCPTLKNCIECFKTKVDHEICGPNVKGKISLYEFFLSIVYKIKGCN